MDTAPIPPRSPKVSQNRSALEKTVQRLMLCRYAVQEAHYEVEDPIDSEEKADLLLAVEDLAYEVMDLLRTAKFFAWGTEVDLDHQEE
jgi:hypothetical protein